MAILVPITLFVGLVILAVYLGGTAIDTIERK
jgi:hypothetical protein